MNEGVELSDEGRREAIGGRILCMEYMRGYVEVQLGGRGLWEGRFALFIKVDKGSQSCSRDKCMAIEIPRSSRSMSSERKADLSFSSLAECRSPRFLKNSSIQSLSSLA